MNKVPNNDCVIFKLDYLRCSTNAYKNRKKRLSHRIHNDCVLLSEFRRKLIDQFCKENFNELIKYCSFAKYFNIKQVPYSKNYLFDQYEIGFDMLEEQYGIRYEHQWRSSYLIIPKVHTEIINWVIKNQPYYATTVKRI